MLDCRVLLMTLPAVVSARRVCAAVLAVSEKLKYAHLSAKRASSFTSTSSPVATDGVSVVDRTTISSSGCSYARGSNR